MNVQWLFVCLPFTELELQTELENKFSDFSDPSGLVLGVVACFIGRTDVHCTPCDKLRIN